MSYAGLTFIDDHTLMEQEYSLLNEANVATLLTTGNGYMGVRASLEEFSSLGIQGLLVRGVMDEVVEVRLTMCDNMYMKKYYVNEERLKKFEKEERAINLLDFLLIRFEIGGEVFYPWEGKLLSWKRWLDLSDETLHREVVWENSKGQKSRLTFRRFASFADDHTYCMEVSIEPLNYTDTVRIISGLDLRTKSNGQMPQTSIDVGFEGQSLWQEEIVGPKYGFHAVTGVSHEFYCESGKALGQASGSASASAGASGAASSSVSAGASGAVMSGSDSAASARWENLNEDGLVAQTITFEAKQNQKYTLEKLIVTVTSRDLEEGKILTGSELLKVSKDAFLTKEAESGLTEETQMEAAASVEPAACDIAASETLAGAVERESGCGAQVGCADCENLSAAPDPILQDCVKRYLAAFQKSSYEKEYEKHVAVYRPLLKKLEISIKGDDTADRAIRFSNYHTLLSIERNDFVHSFSAKGLTGETYNNFVWWDAEIFQAPVFQQTMPEYSKNNILFRYSHLDQARELAVQEGCKGARFPFTTGVTGEETVWIDVRHPFMQIHCVSDVALSVLNYYTCTGDSDFLKEYGMEILMEVSRYWVSRVIWNAEQSRYEILQVTGTDEHHPYVDNNAYTNYSVQHVLSDTLRLLDQFGDELDALKEKIGFTEKDTAEIEEVSEKIYLPLDEKTGMIPQFDGYFDLSRELEVQGGSKSGYTQMKQAGLYNKSQVIKQPDVLMLFAYQNLPLSMRTYRRNVDYYQGRCEAASSLSYCVHSICFADMDMPESTYGYLMETAEMDLKNMHGGTENGVHSGCATGAWTAVVRGVSGMKMRESHVEFTPHFIPWWEEVSFHCIWHGQGYQVTVSNEEMLICADAHNQDVLPVVINGMGQVLKPGETGKYEFERQEPKAR
ncbi:MAG: hypothetical protein LUG99_12525 [Lachnospiraceae bacterium]|nr:hypothetical protein [Lachnospiraceae bacterium]